MTTAVETNLDSASISAYGPARSTVKGTATFSRRIAQDQCLLADVQLPEPRNDLSEGESSPKEPLKPEHIKNRLLGHWGSSPGLSFIYVHSIA